MKAKLLTKLLNDTGYRVNNNREYIAVGSPMCHDLISVNKQTLKIKYALDTFHEGRKSVIDRDNPELLFIWDKLQELIDNGKIQDIINGSDVIENPLPVYTVEEGELIETFTDEYVFPNTTIDGDTMYTNTHFKTKKEALEYGIEDSDSAIECWQRNMKDAQDKVNYANNQIEKHNKFKNHFKSLIDTEL